MWGADLAAGAAKRAADLGPLQIAAGRPRLGDRRRRAQGLRELARPMVALYVGGMGAKGKNFYNTLVRRYGYEQEAEEIQDLYLAGNKEEAAAKVPTSSSTRSPCADRSRSWPSASPPTQKRA